MSVEARRPAHAASRRPSRSRRMDLFALGRQASAARDAASAGAARSSARASSWRAAAGADRATPPSPTSRRRTWPPSAARAAARAAGIDLFVGAADAPDRARAAEGGAPACASRSASRYRQGEDDRERLDRLRALDAAAFAVWGVMPTPDGEPYGLDTAALHALCRLALPRVPHLARRRRGARPAPRADVPSGSAPTSCFAPIVAERALRLGDNANNPSLTRKEAATLIRGAGLAPCERLSNGRLRGSHLLTNSFAQIRDKVRDGEPLSLDDGVALFAAPQPHGAGRAGQRGARAAARRPHLLQPQPAHQRHQRLRGELPVLLVRAPKEGNPAPTR